MNFLSLFYRVADVENEDVCDMILTLDQAAEFTSAVTQKVETPHQLVSSPTSTGMSCILMIFPCGGWLERSFVMKRQDN
jgi:hypothetical protein